MKKLFVICLLLALGAMSLVPVAAQDMVSADCSYGGVLESIEVVDELTVKFTLCTPDPAFPSKVAFTAFNILPSEHLEATGGGGPELFQNPIGTGPYYLENWEQGSEMVFKRFEDYWGDPALEETLIFRWNSEAAARLVELQAGTIDGMDNPGPDDFDLIAADTNLQLLERLGTNVFYIGFSNTVPPMDNIHVRLAVAQGIDKQRLVDNYYPPGSVVATQFMPPAIPSGYTPDFEALPFDQDAARAHLEESGLELPLEVTIYYRDVVRSYLPSPGIVATDIQAQLAQIGINVTIEVQESGTFLDNADGGNLMMHMLGWGADYPDATNFLDFHFGVGASDQFGTKYTEITDRLTAAGQLEDFDARQAIYAEANAYIRDLAPMVPIAHGGSGVAFRADIVGAHSSPLGNEFFAVMEDPNDDDLVWMQNGEPISVYCADETDGETFRACEQVYESLLAYEIGGTKVVPGLAHSYDVTDDLTEWTFYLREGVMFHDGSTLDAKDVLTSFVAQWDAASPLHVGRDGNFTYFGAFFRAFLNAE